MVMNGGWFMKLLYQHYIPGCVWKEVDIPKLSIPQTYMALYGTVHFGIPKFPLKLYYEWKFQGLKLEVPTIYKAYVREYSPKSMAKQMVQYLHFGILKFPLKLCQVIVLAVQHHYMGSLWLGEWKG